MSIDAEEEGHSDTGACSSPHSKQLCYSSMSRPWFPGRGMIPAAAWEGWEVGYLAFHVSRQRNEPSALQWVWQRACPFLTTMGKAPSIRQSMQQAGHSCPSNK